MLGIKPYLSFNGNCKDAIDFYAACLGGTILFSQTYGDSPMNTPGMEDRIMHTSLKIGDSVIMACDSPGEFTQGNNISLALGTDDIPAADAMFDKMSEGGTVLMPMQETFWAPKFGMLTDKFGVNWMFNCESGRAADQ